MSKGIKKVASFALPIAAAFTGNPALMIAASAASGAINGGLKGAVLGGISGYLGSSAGPIGNIAQTATQSATNGGVINMMNNAVAQTANGARSIFAPITSGVKNLLNDPTKMMSIGNMLMAQEGADTAEEAAKKQAAGIQKGIDANAAAQAPYTAMGADAAARIKTIQDDPAGYIRNNEFYNGLADEASRRLMANQAAKGKVGSGGTAAALQQELLNLGNGLVKSDIATLQNQADTGANAAANVGTTAANGYTQQGGVNAAGQVGAYNAYSNGYENQIRTMMALQGLNKTPVYGTPLNL